MPMQYRSHCAENTYDSINYMKNNSHNYERHVGMKEKIPNNNF